MGPKHFSGSARGAMGGAQFSSTSLAHHISDWTGSSTPAGTRQPLIASLGYRSFVFPKCYIFVFVPTVGRAVVRRVALRCFRR